MPKPVCIPCGREMLVAKIGIVIEFTRRGSYTQHPYQKASGDVLACPGCGARIVAKYGAPIEHFDPLYEQIKADMVVPE